MSTGGKLLEGEGCKIRWIEELVVFSLSEEFTGLQAKLAT